MAGVVVDSEETLRAENARLVAEMASMKKKIMSAMKKQSAEVKAAQQRAKAAEEALAAHGSGNPSLLNSQLANHYAATAATTTPPKTPDGSGGGGGSVGSESPSLELAVGGGRLSTNGDDVGDEAEGDAAPGLWSEIESLRAELVKEQEQTRSRQEVFELEKQRLEQELVRLKESFESDLQKMSDGNRALEAELSSLKETSQEQAEQLKKANVQLELQLESVVPKDRGEEANFLQQYEQISKELEETRAALVEAHRQQAEEKLKVNSLQQQLEGNNLKGIEQQDDLHVSSSSQLQVQYNDLQQQLQESQTKVQNLQLELHDRLQHQQAAEAAALRLSMACASAEQRADTVSTELADASMKFNEETKVRDEKYAELDAKFNRLLKRSKQRIQEVQKEREDVEAQLKVVEEKLTQALTGQAALQADLDQTRSQAGDTIRTLDSERQQLNTAVRRLREEIEELHRLLDAKEHNLAESRRLASEKDQMVLEMASVVKEAEAKHEASIMDLKDKHQMVIVGFESQLADSVKERSKVDEMVTSLQALLADKESQLVEVEAASSGELVRLGALLDAARGDSARLTLEHKKQQEEWDLAVTQLKSKLEASEELQIQLAASAAKTRSELESELERLRQTLSASQAELGRMRDEAAQRAEELAAYKVRAYALLQKKEAELSAAQDSELVAAKEAALQEAKKEAAAAGAERDRAVQALQATVTKYQTQLDARAGAILEAEQHIRELATKLESSKSLMLSQQVEWHARLQQVEETCRVRCEAAEAKAKVNRPDETELANELSALHSTHEQLKGEFETYQDLANRTIESKDREISRLLSDNAALQKSSHVHSQAASDALDKSEARAPVAAEQQILLLARQQAKREEEVTQCRRHILALQEEISELEHENRLHCQQETMLKEELRKVERAQKREGVDMTYVKNVILKLLETGEVEALLPVIAMLLQFSPEELRRCHEAYKIQATAEVPLSGAAAVVDAAAAAPRSLLSRLTGV
ncbi:hypothetical protein BDL97_14G073300 [Sphagnum fallax]|nr:hypothetical protein BDL97_14G073300 [Sphagnum fallax]